MEITLNQAINNTGDVLDYLTYTSYRHNRRLAPHISVEAWGRVFEDVERYETLYQLERQ